MSPNPVFWYLFFKFSWGGMPPDPLALACFTCWVCFAHLHQKGPLFLEKNLPTLSSAYGLVQYNYMHIHSLVHLIIYTHIILAYTYTCTLTYPYVPGHKHVCIYHMRLHAIVLKNVQPCTNVLMQSQILLHL